MLCLGIESTAHTFGCSIIEIDKNSDAGSAGKEFILSEVRDIYKASAGWGIHPRDASKHHSTGSDQNLKRMSRRSWRLVLRILILFLILLDQDLGPCLRIGAVISRFIGFFS